MKHSVLTNLPQTIVILLLAGVVLAGIAMTGCERESVCDDVRAGESYLCDIMHKMAQETGANVTLEDIGDSIIMINAVAMARGDRTAADTRALIEKLLQSLDGSVTYALFSESLEKAIGAGAISVAKPVLDRFSLSKNLMKNKDREMLKGWLHARLEDLS